MRGGVVQMSRDGNTDSTMSHSGKSLMRGRSSGFRLGIILWSKWIVLSMLKRRVRKGDTVGQSCRPFSRNGLRDLHQALLNRKHMAYTLQQHCQLNTTIPLGNCLQTVCLFLRTFPLPSGRILASVSLVRRSALHL